MSLFPGIKHSTHLIPTRCSQDECVPLRFRFVTALLLRCRTPPTSRRFGRCLHGTVGCAAVVTPAFFRRFSLAFCLAKQLLISVFRRLCYIATVCCALKLRLRKLICFAHEHAFARLLAAGSSSSLAGSYLADRCDLFLGAVNGVARLHCHQLRITAAISTAAML